MRRWCVYICRRKCFDILRKRKANEIPLDEDMGASEPIETAVLKQETFAAMIAALDSLSPTSRQIIEGKYLQGLSMAEIAGELDITVVQVNSRIQRARTKIRENLESEGLL